jgi:hypothetical protein
LNSTLSTIPNSLGSTQLLLLRLDLIDSHFLPRAAVFTLMDNPLPAQHLLRIFDILDSREVVFVLLHCSDPGYIVKGHDLEAEVLVVTNLLDFAEEGGEVGCGNVVHVSKEVCWSELLRVSQGTWKA